ERERLERAAGLRTHALVAVSSSLLMIVSAYGFADVMGVSQVSFDPSRVAAQVVSGIGFIGGGLIFVRRDAVRGLTTAAIVWVTAAIGMACGAGLAEVALVVTAGHMVIVFIYPKLAARLPASRYLSFAIRVVYEDGRGILRRVLAESTALGFSILTVDTHQLDQPVSGAAAVAVTLEVQGRPSAEELTIGLEKLDGVIEISALDLGRNSD
ncbi:MAG: hypothetical protein DLM65_01060, partial [Candidatus Aeolococcus gillhamiae]